MSNDFDEALKASAESRKEMERRFGFVPLSVLNISRGHLSRQMYLFQNEEKGRRTTQKSGDGTALERERRGIKGGFVQGLSIMPAELVDFFIKYYAKPGDTYVDPFMGQGVQMQVAKMNGLHYRGMDLSTEFFRYIESTKLKIDDGKTIIDIHHGDSRFPVCIPDGCADFSFHSPPYWDVEYYGDEPEQLGMNTYDAFLDGMHQVAKSWLPKFKHGAYHVVNVNDFRRNGEFYPYHSDTISIFRKAGWAIHDTWIIEGLVGGLPRVFAGQMNLRNKIAPKTHEYAIVFRAP